MRLRSILFGLFVVVCAGSGAAHGAACNTSGGGTQLGNAAANLSAGEWCELTTTGLNDSLIETESRQSITQYGHQMAWDTVNNNAVWVGSPTQCRPSKMIFYRDVNNTWYEGTTPFVCRHGYDHIVSNPATGYVYVRKFSDPMWLEGVWNGSDDYDWTEKASISCSGSSDASIGIAWDASRDGALAVTEQSNDLYACFWDRATNTWSLDDSISNVNTYYNQSAQYSVEDEMVWLTAAFTYRHWKDDGGVVTEMPSSGGSPTPFDLGCCSNSAGEGATNASYAGNGKFVLVNGTVDWWEYDLGSDTWTDITHSMPPLLIEHEDNSEDLSVWVDDYGVILYLSYDRDYEPSPALYVYKHVDTGLVITGSSPSGEQAHDTSYVTMTVTTDASATCKWNRTASVPYASKEAEFYSTGGTSHSQVVAVVNGQSYTYYVQCNDGTNTSSEQPISWSVASGNPSLPLGNCVGEDFGLRTDIVYCESMESQTFWSGQGYLYRAGDPYNEETATSTDFENVTLQSSGCISNNCIKVTPDIDNYVPLNVSWPLREAEIEPDELYIRYYYKLSADFDPYAYGDSKTTWDGKQPIGFADIRTGTNNPQTGQCGNGGYPGDGINCLSARNSFRTCDGLSSPVCQPGSNTRIGGYLYYGQRECCPDAQTCDEYDPANSWGTGVVCSSDSDCEAGESCTRFRYKYGHSFWDSNTEANAYKMGTCAGNIGNTGDCGDETSSVSPGLVLDQWYLIEIQVKMNAVGVDDGIYRAWLDGTLVYEKTNMVWRIEGHDNIHPRALWMTLQWGGEPTGADPTGSVYIDQLVVATDEPIGSFGAPKSVRGITVAGGTMR